LRTETLRLARRIAEAGELVVALGKHAYYAQIDLDQSDAYDYTQGVMTQNALARDAQEGISAFLEKRQPVWKGN
jgi:enoyl-CoA hydratase/carnithine racemase